MKITAISPHVTASAELICESIRQAVKERANLIVLPGLASNTPSPEAIGELLKPGVWAYVEASDPGQGNVSQRKTVTRDGKGKGQPLWQPVRALLVSHAQIVELPRQVFPGRPAKHQQAAFRASLPERTRTIGGKAVTFVLCGEINGIDLDGHLKGAEKLACEVLINPAHTTMGRWHVLNKKFSALSRQGVVVHVANNDNAGLGVTTGLRIYDKGERVSLGDCSELIRSFSYEL